MTTPCSDILKKAGLSKEERELVEIMSRQGESTSKIKEKFFKAIEDNGLTDKSDKVREAKTNDYLELLQDIVLNSKTAYKRLFELLVGDKSGITSRTLGRTQERFGYMASLLKMSNSDIKWLLNQETFVKHLVQEMNHFKPKSKTGNKLAYEVASALVDRQRMQVGEMNSFGAGMHWLDDYVTKQWHDPFRMLKAGEDKWVNDIHNRLDYNVTKERVLRLLDERGIKLKEEFDLKKYLRSTFRQLTTKEAEDGMLITYLRASRSFAFKDADALINYNTIYGHKNMAHAIFENMTLYDNHISLGETMGYGYTKKIEPDKITKEMVQEEVVEAKRMGEPGAIKEAEKKFRKLFRQDVNPVKETKAAIQFLKDNKKISNYQYRRLRGALAQVSGDAHMIASPTLAKMTMGFQFWQYLTTLGKATLGSVNDLWTSPLLLHFQGVKPGGAYLGMINHMLRKTFKQIPKAERDMLLRQFRVGVDGVFESYSRNFINTPKMGVLNDMTDKMFDWNLLNWWTNSTREGAAKMMSNHFADNLSLNFNKLPDRFKKLIGEYEIGAKEWDLLKKIGAFDETAFNPKGSKKVKYITSDWIGERAGELGIDSKIAKPLQESLNRYYVMESRLAIPEAGAAERAWMYGDSKRGSLPETGARLFFQFRTFQVKLIRGMIPRMREMGLPSLMHIIPALTFGYLSISLKKMVAGKMPPAYDDPNTLTDALVHSGVAGFIGDFIGGQYGRYQHEIDEVLLGSAWSTIKSWGELASGLTSGDKNSSDVWKELRYNIPYGNLFYTEAVINYGLHYGLMETFSPGYLKRMEAREDGLNEGFIMNPSSVWSFGGLR